MVKKYISILIVLSLALWGCNAPEPDIPEDPGAEQTTGGEDDPDTPDTPGGDPGVEEGIPLIKVSRVLDPGVEKVDKPVYPSHPDLVREEECQEFYDPVYDWITDFGNIDYVLVQGFGTAWPMITDDLRVRLYQGSGNKGGNYIRIRAKYDAKILGITVGSATDTKVAWTLGGKARKSATEPLAAGSRLVLGEDVLGAAGTTEVCLYCMGTSQSERWELDDVKVRYKGGYTDEDFYVEPVEYGPLVEVNLPCREDFENDSFVYMKTNTYDKYGTTEGPENLNWSTWYGCFSWQHPKTVGESFGVKSPQIRVYQEDDDYEKSQFGDLKTEFFIKNLKSVKFQYCFTEYWVSATISYCAFGSSEWTGSKQIKLGAYGDRETIQNFTYILDEGKAHDAKIRIEVDEATGHPTKDHYDLIFDNFIFE